MAAVDRARLEELFHRLVGQSPAERAGFLASLTGADAELAPELEALLDGHEPGGPLDRLTEELVPAPLAAPWDPQATLTGTSVGQYEVGELIGRGGMGDVYRARDTRLGRDVALKFLPAWLGRDPAARDRFLVEARSVSSIDDANVCTLHDLGEADDGRLFLIMPYYAGESLKQRLAEGPLPVERAVDVALQTARGLAAAHERGVIHRDVKPGNLLLTGDGRVKILDFGVAKLVDVHMTRTGETPGTASYMSPEQRAGDEVDARSDLWSLGAVLYEMLTGKRPGGEAAVRSGLASVPAALAEIVERLLAESPEERYPDARSLAEDLAVLAEGGEVLSARPAPSIKRFLAELKRRKVFRVVAVYGVMGFGVIEVAGNVFPQILLPEWTVSLVVWLVLLGFPVAVVLAWAFETSPDGGVRRTRSVRPAILDAIVALPARRRWPIGLAAALGGALVVIGAWWALGTDWTRGDARTTLAPGTEEAPITIAVVAATSSDTTGLEGLAGSLALGLGNVPGLRAAPENLVSDAWQDRDRSIADSAAALEVARKVGAHGAVLVSAISAGSRLRLYANVYWTETDGESGVPLQVEGVSESLIELADELAVQVAGSLSPGEGQAAAIASRSTRSLPAFRAFLLGERELRSSDLAASIPHFRLAVTEDSSFGLAWYRLALACGWGAAGGCEGDERDHAIAHAGELPDRERLLVRAANIWGGSPSRLTDVEDAVRRSPDDAQLWNALGEVYMHNGWRAGLSPRAADSAFTRAVELLPRDSDALHHRIDIAQAFFHDPVMSERRIEERGRIIGRVDDEDRLKHDLVFNVGNPTLPARFAAVPTSNLGSFHFAFAHPLSAPARLMRDEIVTARGNPPPEYPQFFAEIARGRLAAALRAGDTEELPPPTELPPSTDFYFHPFTRACRAYMLSLAGVDLDGTRADGWLDPATTDSAVRREELVCRGGHAVDEERWAEAEGWLLELENDAAEADSSARPYWTAPATALRNYLVWSRDGTEPVVIDRSTRLYLGHVESWPVRWWMGQMLRAGGRPEEALRVFESYWLPAWLPAWLERAEISAELGRHGEARVLYETVLTLWADADAPLRPLVERARAGLAGLGPTEAMTPTDPR